MKFYMIDTEELKEITLKSWNEESEGYSEDMFDEFEQDFQSKHERLPGGDAFICAKNEFDELITWWEEEVRCMNARKIGQNGADYTDADDIANHDELVLFAD